MKEEEFDEDMVKALEDDLLTLIQETDNIEDAHTFVRALRYIHYLKEQCDMR